MIVKEILKDLYLYIKLCKFKSDYQKLNKHNFTRPTNIFNLNHLSIGKNTYGHINVVDYGNNQFKLKIGNYCSIADGVTFILSGDHDYKKFSTYPFESVFNNNFDTVSKGNIIIEDDVWIGQNCIILSGVKIGRGSIVGAGSVVSKNVAPYSIFVNNTVIKKRFSNEVIKTLNSIDFNKIDIENIKKNKVMSYNIDEKNVSSVVQMLTKGNDQDAY